jgi:hypothetical protein
VGRPPASIGRPKTKNKNRFGEIEDSGSCTAASAHWLGEQPGKPFGRESDYLLTNLNLEGAIEVLMTQESYGRTWPQAKIRPSA